MAIPVDPFIATAKEETSASSPAAPKPSVCPRDEIRAVARKFSDEPIQNPDPSVWAVLTAISANARRRPQGMNILLSADEHCLGRCVEDTRYQIGALAISSKHCKISRERAVTKDNASDSNSIHAFLKDTSTNGTYLNWERLRKNSPKAKLQHGDLISFIAPPHDDNSFAFVYREVRKPVCLTNGAAIKRKAEEFGAESKRLKGIGIGAPEGPISLDDVRSLQRSNTELRQQVESHILTIETLQSENRECISRHEKELKEQKETISSSFLDQIKEFQNALDVKQKELDELNMLSAELRSSIKDLNERLEASMQSRVDADEIINSQKATISDLEAQLAEERYQRREEREKAEADLKSAVQRANLEAQAEMKRQTDVYLIQQREQQEVINKLQESEKESRLLLETLRSKLEDARENIILSEKKVRHLEGHLQDEQTASARSRERIETLESELRRLRKDLESEKVAREEAWAKVSTLELEIDAAIRDLSIEKQRFQGARERIILRETQLRAFYSTTEEISSLFVKQQEQLKAMQKTLEDEDNYENTSFGIDLNEPAIEKAKAVYARSKEYTNPSSNTREASGSGSGGSGDDGDDDDNSVTEKHDCDVRRQDDNTQDLEYTSTERFAADIEGVGTAAVPDGDTERVPGTESQVGDYLFNEQNTTLQKSSNEAGDTMQLDIETQPQENLEPTEKPDSPSRMEDTETNTIKTADLLASEVAGSWAVSTAPSAYGENESPRSMELDAGAGNQEEAAAALLLCSHGESQTNVACGSAKMSEEHRALNAMIDIVAPEFRRSEEGGNGDSMSDAETEDDDNSVDGSHDEGEDDTQDAVEDENEAVIEDSVG